MNPSFLQTELSQIAKEDYPTILKNRSLPSVGYICELRIQVPDKNRTDILIADLILLLLFAPMKR